MKAHLLKKRIGPITITTGMFIRVFATQTFSEKNFIVTPEQFTILALLVEHGELYQRQIAEIILKDRPNVTRLINILEKLELVKRVQDSNRRKIYKILVTDKGREIYGQILPTEIEVRKQAAQNITDEELETFFNVLDKIQENLKDKVKLQI